MRPEPPCVSTRRIPHCQGNGSGMPPEPSTDPAIITGIPASAGTVQGRAKVVRNLAEASKIDPGDIPVCEMTMPPWTPLFATISAIVADTGGRAQPLCDRGARVPPPLRGPNRCWPNKALQPTPNSLRSSLAPALGRG